MNKLSAEKRAAILTALVEGSSVNGTARMMGCSKVTILRLLVDVASYCADYHDLMVRKVASRRIQADEIWSFCGCKARSKKAGAKGHGDVWIWCALDADSKFAVSYHVGARSTEDAMAFITDLGSRLADRVQVSTDGYRPYVEAIEAVFRGNLDYGRIMKTFSTPRDGEARYSPPICTGCRKDVVAGNPDPDHISTSHVERQNLQLRMGCRRFTRLTNAHSKRLENHAAAVHLHYFFYNWIRKHMSLKTTPAVAAGLASKPITMLDLVAMVEKEEKLTGGRLTDYLPAAEGK